MVRKVNTTIIIDEETGLLYLTMIKQADQTKVLLRFSDRRNNRAVELQSVSGEEIDNIINFLEVVRDEIRESSRGSLGEE